MAKEEESVSMMVGAKGSKCRSVGADVNADLRQLKAASHAIDQTKSLPFRVRAWRGAVTRE